MANSVTHAALPYPVRGARYTIAVPFDNIADAAESPATQVSKDGGAYADATEELTIISGGDIGYITLTGAETDCRLLIVKTDVVSGIKATVLDMSPQKLPILFSGTAQAGGLTSLRQQAGFPNIDNFFKGCVVKTTGGTGGGGTGGANNQGRMILASNGSNGDLTVEDWEVNPASGTTYDILLTEFSLISQLASNGLDFISITAPTGVAANFREMLVQTWRRLFKKTVASTADNTIKTYADDGTTVITNQAITETSTVQTQGAAT